MRIRYAAACLAACAALALGGARAEWYVFEADNPPEALLAGKASAQSVSTLGVAVGQKGQTFFQSTAPTQKMSFLISTISSSLSGLKSS